MCGETGSVEGGWWSGKTGGEGTGDVEETGGEGTECGS